MPQDVGLAAHEQLTCGCHVHVEISSAEKGVAVLDRAGPWLAPLLALSANSPFWQGLDSSYASRAAPRVRTELLRLAAWRASRSGLDGFHAVSLSVSPSHLPGLGLAAPAIAWSHALLRKDPSPAGKGP